MKVMSFSFQLSAGLSASASRNLPAGRYLLRVIEMTNDTAPAVGTVSVGAPLGWGNFSVTEKGDYPFEMASGDVVVSAAITDPVQGDWAGVVGEVHSLD